MTIGERVKELRKQINLTQQAFADRLNLKRNTVGSYEVNVVEPSDRTISDICREFNVNETWLRTGEGEMFNQITRSEKLPPFSVTSPKMMATISNVGLWRCWQSWSPRTGAFGADG